MITRWLRTVTAALAALAAARAAAAGYGSSSSGAPAFARDAWPTALVLRPLTLAREMVEIAAPVAIDLTPGAGRPVSAPVAVHAGATDWLTLGVSHARGLCVSGRQADCASASDDLSVDALAQFYGAGPLAAAYGVSLSGASLGDSVALSGEALLELRLAHDPVAVVLAPRYGFGFTHREATRIAAVPFPLADTLPFGTSGALPNRETVTAPLTAMVQLGTHLALAAAIAVSGVLDPQQGRFADSYRVPVGFAAVVSPIAMLDLGASFTFPNLWGVRDGPRPRSDGRELEAFLAWRPGARARRVARAAPAPGPAAVEASAGAVPAAAEASAAPATIVIADLAFTPRTLEVPPGATVTVRNRDAFPHSVTSERAPGAFAPGAVGNVGFDTGPFGAGERTFVVSADAAPGTVVPFYCSVHRGEMRTPDGELRIVAPATPRAP